jgi:hypothetical protein
MSFHTERQVKRSLKQRKCDWCWEVIAKGEAYVAAFGTFDGTYKSQYHPECAEAMHRFCDEVLLYGEPLPQDRMNRGGIRLYGEEEK